MVLTRGTGGCLKKREFREHIMYIYIFIRVRTIDSFEFKNRIKRVLHYRY